MKKFSWPLQRLLDVTAQRETLLRAELLAMLPALAATRQQIVARRAQVRAMLSDLAGADLQQRIPQQELAMRFSHVSQRVIDHLTGKLRRLEARRDETLTRFTEARAARERLERLREKSYAAYLLWQSRLEQKLLDESSQNAHARKTATTPPTRAEAETSRFAAAERSK